MSSSFEPATDTPGTELTARLAQSRSVVAVALLFAVNGLIIGGFGGTLPSIAERLDLGPTDISALLIASGLAAITGMQLGGRLSDAIGARRVALTGLPLLIAAAVAFALATTFPLAIGAAFLLGLGNGTIDIAMNAIGVQVEAARRRPIMSTLHAMWSLGGFVGAASVLLVATVLDLRGAAVVMPLLLFLASVASVAFVVAYRSPRRQRSSRTAWTACGPRSRPRPGCSG